MGTPAALRIGAGSGRAGALEGGGRTGPGRLRRAHRRRVCTPLDRWSISIPARPAARTLGGAASTRTSGWTWRVVEAREVPDDFHARFSARWRHYRYLLLNRPDRPAVLGGRVARDHRPLDLARLRAAAGRLVGTHDFSAYRASACQARSPVRTLHALHVEQRGARVWFDVVADGFLHHMVRNIVGVLLAIGGGGGGARMGARGPGRPRSYRGWSDRERRRALSHAGRLPGPLSPARGVARFGGLVISRRARPDQDLRPHPAGGCPAGGHPRSGCDRAQLLPSESALPRPAGGSRGAREHPSVRDFGRGVRQPRRGGGPAGDRGGRSRHAAISRDRAGRILRRIRAALSQGGGDARRGSSSRRWPASIPRPPRSCWTSTTPRSGAGPAGRSTGRRRGAGGGSIGRSCWPADSIPRTSRRPSDGCARSRWTCAGEWNRPEVSRTRRCSRPSWGG